MEQFILDFLESVGNINFKFVWNIFLYALIVFWFVVLYWVWLDSGDRTSNRSVRYLYVLLVASLNVVGWIIYLIIRPTQTIEEIYWADLERRYLKYETAELGDCPKCGTQLYPGFTFCPNCKYKLKKRCERCEVLVDKKNKYCPYCGQEMKKKSSTVKELVPTQEVMEKQIQATKDEATEVVEANMTRYSTKKGFSVKIGESIVNGYKLIIDRGKRFFSKDSKDKGIDEKEQKAANVNGNSKKKKGKKSK
jgi:RNA polymerase subunit RPABC4/transcription elongation factor Spt4